MSIILQSTVFKGSKNKSAILAAMNNPINRELVQQIDFLDAYDDVEPEVDSEGVDIANTPEGEAGGSESSFSPSMGGGFSGGSFTGDDFSEDLGDDSLEFEESGLEGEGSEDGVMDDEGFESVEDLEDVDDEPVESSTAINAGTFVNVETVANAVNEIPGTLNCVEETQGVTHCILKGGSDNEIWIYYSTEVDINSVLENVNKTLITKDYNFLEFDRVSREKNAIVYSINWVSSYYKPRLTIENE